MKYLSAYCMVALSGAAVTKESVKKVLASVGCEVDVEALQRVFSAMEGKTLHEVIASGMSKLASVGSSSAAPAQASSTAAPAKVEEKKPEPEEEEEEEVDMGDLFGDF